MPQILFQDSLKNLLTCSHLSCFFADQIYMKIFNKLSFVFLILHSSQNIWKVMCILDFFKICVWSGLYMVLTPPTSLLNKIQYEYS